MKAYRNVGGVVTEVEVDVDPNGQPILPPDTTVEERPSPLAGHYVTVVGKNWEQIPVPVEFKTFETKKQEALAKLKAWSVWYFEQPIEHEGVKFDADGKARERLTQAVTGLLTGTGFPPVWVAYDDSLFPLPDADALKALAVAVIQTAFSTRFFEYNTLRSQMTAAEDEDALNAIEIPAITSSLF